MAHLDICKGDATPLNINQLSNLFKANVKQHSPLILSVAAGVGTFTTAYLAAKASFRAAKVIDRYEELEGISDNRKEQIKDRIKVTWKLYIPTAISASATIVCIAGSNRVGARKLLASQAALSMTQQLYSDYREKVIEQFGDKKEELVRAAVAEDRVKGNPPPSQEVLVTGPGNVLCCEMFTGRYFTSDMETLRRAQNDLNKKVLSQDYATMDDFYYLIGLKPTSYSGNIGWSSSRQMDLEFTTVLTEDGRPCLAFDYNYTKQL